MPKPRKDESEKAYIPRCIKHVMEKEGLNRKQAAGKCFGMWRNRKKGKK